jgi:hypothetical protein
MEEINEDVISDIAYSICTAVSEVSGRSGMAFVSMVGKNLLYTVEEKKDLPKNRDDSVESLNDFLSFFVDLGYASRIRASLKDNALTLDFENIKFLESEELLMKEKSAVLPLYVTFAARAFMEKYFDMSLVYKEYRIKEGKTTMASLRIL